MMNNELQERFTITCALLTPPCQKFRIKIYLSSDFLSYDIQLQFMTY